MSNTLFVRVILGFATIFGGSWTAAILTTGTPRQALWVLGFVAGLAGNVFGVVAIRKGWVSPKI